MAARIISAMCDPAGASVPTEGRAPAAAPTA
jgi:hypothetical protein